MITGRFGEQMGESGLSTLRQRSSGHPGGNVQRSIGGILASLIILSASLLGCASTPPPPAPSDATVPVEILTPSQREDNVASFDVIWQTVRDKHWLPDLGGLDWDAARAELRPQVAAATTMRDARRVMRDLLGRLQESHFAVIPASVYDEVADSTATGGSRGGGDAGVEVRVVDGHALVTFVHPDGAAAGLLEPGWQLARIDGVDVDSLLAAVHRGLIEAETDTLRLEFLLATSVMNRLGGNRGDVVNLTAVAGGGERIPVALTLGNAPGQSTTLGNLPSLHVWYLDRMLDGDVAYVRFNNFLDPMQIMGRFEQTLEAHANAAGVVIDLRGNTGGLPGMAMGMAGFLVAAKDQRLGTMRTRDMSLNFVVNPRQPHFAGPVAVLVDGLSMSTSEIMAGGLQDLGRARIFGTRSPGAALPSVVSRLPNGDGFQYAFADYVSTGGEHLEGRGVVPDEVVPPDRNTLLQGRDPVIEAAVAWIRQAHKKG